MLKEFQSFRQNPLRWIKRRYLRWFALTYWSCLWLVRSGPERQFAQLQILRVSAGFDRASWLLAIEDFIKPEYWGIY
jgi:hypothetical protein